MVITSLLSKIIPLAAVGLGIAFLANVLTKPAQASESAGALGQTFGAFGSGLGSIGGGESIHFCQVLVRDLLDYSIHYLH